MVPTPEPVSPMAPTPEPVTERSSPGATDSLEPDDSVLDSDSSERTDYEDSESSERTDSEDSNSSESTDSTSSGSRGIPSVVGIFLVIVSLVFVNKD